MKQSFDEWYNDSKTEDFPNLGDAFKAGQQSKQEEIDEIQKKYNAMHNAFVVADDCRQEWHRCYVGVRQREDELQKRIDGALIELEALSLMKTVNSNNAIKILKGENHES